jgi:hypothetical protein
VSQLLEGWRGEQAWFVEFVGDRVSFEKSWEMYLVLTTDLEPLRDELSLLETIRRDTSYTRKILIPGVEVLSPARVWDFLAPLRPLSLDIESEVPDAMRLLEDEARSDGRDDVLETLARYRENRPLFEVNE